MRRPIHLIAATFAWALLPGLVAAADAGHAQPKRDPDAEVETLHVQPAPLSPAKARPSRERSTTVLGSVTLVDVLLASGYDVAGEDRGNEPSLAVNPLDPSHLVLTSFTGSDWGINGGPSTLFYSSDAGATWSLLQVIPRPPGTTTDVNCPCDQTVDWGRDGQLYATFLWSNTGDTERVIYSAQTPTPDVAGSWVYRTSGGQAQITSLPGLTWEDQPWLASGPVSETQPATNACVAYDHIDPLASNTQTRVADSPNFTPLNFVNDQPTHSDGMQYGDGMNPGHRLAVGPTGVMFDVYQRFVADAGSGVKQLTYLISASTDGGATWSVANSDHPSGAKIIAANVLSFQGYDSKVGGVNALLGGVTAIGVDPASGTAWVVYGTRATVTSHDNLYLVPVTYGAGSLLVGTARRISPAPFDSYLPSVAVLPNGEVGVLYLSYNSMNSTFFWNLIQTTNGGATNAGNTGLGAFTSPFAPDAGQPRQRILGDYVQLKAAGCDFVGAFPATGQGVNSVASIVPYFVRAPAATPCAAPTLTGLNPNEACVGQTPFAVTVQGTGFLKGATARSWDNQTTLWTDRQTAYVSDTQLTTIIGAGELSYEHGYLFNVLNAAPAGGLTPSPPYVSFSVETPAVSPGNTLRAWQGAGNVLVQWQPASGASRYNVKRCTANSGPCTPVTIATVTGFPETLYGEPTAQDGNNYWYTVEAVNACGAVP
jgi:hypothetical protein